MAIPLERFASLSFFNMLRSFSESSVSSRIWILLHAFFVKAAYCLPSLRAERLLITDQSQRLSPIRTHIKAFPKITVFTAHGGNRTSDTGFGTMVKSYGFLDIGGASIF